MHILSPFCIISINSVVGVVDNYFITMDNKKSHLVVTFLRTRRILGHFLLEK